MRIVNWTECGCLSLLNKAAERVAPNFSKKESLKTAQGMESDFKERNNAR